MINIPDITGTPDKPLNKSNVDPLRNDVPPEGFLESSRYAFVAEAPGSAEMKQKKPLVGQAGMMFDRLLNAVSISRYQCYLTNFCKTKLPNNDETTLITKKGKKHEAFGQLQARLIQELSQLHTEFIVLMGDTAMKALLDDPRFDKITSFRGSAYHAEEFPHLAEPLKGKKILLTNHPASCLPYNNPKNFYVIMNDLQKLQKLEQDPSLLDVSYTTHINPQYPEVIEFLNQVLHVPETSFDIEANPRQTTCFSFTISPHEAMSVPLINNSGNVWNIDQETEIWQLTAQILESSSPGLIMQNGMFDMMFMLRTLGIKTNSFIFDTMLAQHLCWADLPKGLDFITSVYTYHPYYKDEGKQTHLKAIKDWEQYWLYNARDAIITHQVKPELEKQITMVDAWDTFNFLMRLHKPLAEMEYNGIRTDQSETSGIPKARSSLNRQVAALDNALARLAGKRLNINSAPQMKQYFYFDLGIKPYVNRKTGSMSVDSDALTRIARKKGKGYREAKIVKKMREKKKLLSNYFNVSVDPDNRLRCQFKISGTDSGRLSSAGTFFGTGTNLQNIPPNFKRYLIPDEGYVLGEIDLAQAEAVVVAYDSQDANMIKGFESEVDVHTYNASQIFEKPMDEVTKTERSLGKRVVHASNYNMGYKTFALQAEIPENRAYRLLEAYHARFPGLRRWHKEIENKIRRDRMLHNLFGRPKRFLGMIDNALLRSAFSFIPQSTVAEQLNRGMTTLAEDPRTSEWGIQFLLTVHDSVVFQFPDIYTPSEVADMLQFIRPHMEIPLYTKGTEFVINMEAKLSRSNWKNLFEFKDFSHEALENHYHKV